MTTHVGDSAIDIILVMKLGCRDIQFPTGTTRGEGMVKLLS